MGLSPKEEKAFHTILKSEFENTYQRGHKQGFIECIRLVEEILSTSNKPLINLQNLVERELKNDKSDK